MKIEPVRFEGIDDFNRPIFKSIQFRNRFGSVNKLFDYGATEEEVLKTITEADLCYFGTSFNCEPMGDYVDNIKIITSF